MDIVTEVFAGGLLSIMAGIIALISGAYVVATIILITSVFVTAFWMVLFFMSSKKTFRLPNFISSIAKKLGKEKAIHYVEETNTWIAEVCDMSRKNLRTSKSRKVFINSFLLSVVSWIFYGVSFMIIALGTGYGIDVFDSVMAVMGANAIGNLPITVGGSGLAEFGIVAYLNNLNPFDFDIPEGSIEWNAIIGWRIATYYVPIIVTWLLLVKLALSRISKSNVTETS